MTNTDSLFLYEEIMLLALQDEEGTIGFGLNYSFAVGGAILAELLLNKRIGVEEVRKKKFVSLIDSTPMDNPLLDECLEKIRLAKRRGTFQTWVSKIANLKNIKHRIAQQLCMRGILKADEDKVLLLFTRKIYPEINPEPERQLIERLRQTIFTESEDLDPTTVVLVSLAKNADLLKTAFDKKELKSRKDRIEKITNGEITGKAAKEAIEAMQAAIIVATVIPTVIVATTST